MLRRCGVLLLFMSLAGFSFAQSNQPSNNNQNEAANTTGRSKEAGESSSRDTRIDITPPANDAKDHPESAGAVAEAEGRDRGGVEDFHPWDPHRAQKDIEVGNFYFKKKNYRAALDRFKEALEYKPNDAVANFRMAECFEKLQSPEDAATHYEAYLKILPHGPLAADAQKGLDRMQSAQKIAGSPDKQ